jgi:hypothetical protein
VLHNPGISQPSNVNFLTGSVDKFGKLDFGKQGSGDGLSAEKKWECPYIFMDVPRGWSAEFPEEMIGLGLKASFSRTRAASGIVSGGFLSGLPDRCRQKSLLGYIPAIRCKWWRGNCCHDPLPSRPNQETYASHGHFSWTHVFLQLFPSGAPFQQ